MQLIFILANGEISSQTIEASKQRVQARTMQSATPPIVIAADGGARYAAPLSLGLHYVIGDMDSVEPRMLTQFPAATILPYPVQKDETDLELALNLAQNLLFAACAKEQRNNLPEHQVVILGASGGRLDMTIANVHLLAQESFAALQMEMWTERETLRILRPPSAELNAQEGQRVSLIALEPAIGIKTSGLEYALNLENLNFASPRGLSNRMLNNLAAIEWQSGLLLCIQDNQSGIEERTK